MVETSEYDKAAFLKGSLQPIERLVNGMRTGFGDESFGGRRR